jgi:drug/metabolite transporter (DMT)-like permease
MNDFRENAIGISAILACCFFFILNDTMVKAAGDTLPLGQLLFLRGVLATAIIGAFAFATGALRNIRAHLTPLVGWRTFGEVTATFLYLSALLHLPIANASTIAQAAPLVITAAGAILFREHVGWRRWTAVSVGFVGILLIVRPGTEGFNAYSLLVLASVFMVVLRDIVTRYIPATTPTLTIAFVTSASVMVASGGLAATEDWQPVGLGEAGLLAGSAVSVLLGFVLSIVAMRHGDVSLVAPFRYSFILYAIFLGWLVWGDVPDAITFVGIAVVVSAGIYTVWRERVRVREAKVAAAAAKTLAASA